MYRTIGKNLEVAISRSIEDISKLIPIITCSFRRIQELKRGQTLNSSSNGHYIYTGIPFDKLAEVNS